MRIALAALVTLSLCVSPTVVRAEDRRVGPGETYATLGAGLGAALDGDVVVVAAGVYDEALRTSADGVTIRGAGAGAVVVRASGTVLRVDHDRVRVEGLTLDGQYGAGDALIVRGSDFVLLGAEVHSAGRDCIDIGGAVSRVRIEGAQIHHCLATTASACSADACRVDAHGIVADQVQGLEVIDTHIYAFSGDAIQLNGRDQPTMWQDVVVRGCLFELTPLASAAGGFAAGVVPGENAIDTKTPDDIATPARMTITDTVARGFRGGLIANMAAYNLKENVIVRLDRVSVSDSEIAFRVRGATSSRPRGAQVSVDNAVVYDVDTAFRYEDDLSGLLIRHCTLGASVTRAFQRAGASMAAVTGTHVLMLGASLPPELSAGTNMTATTGDFVNAAGDDYHLVAGAAAVDAADALADVLVDRDGVSRPQGTRSDVGAYEHCVGCVPEDAGSPIRDAGATGPSDGGPVSGLDGGSVGPRADAGPTAASSSGCGCRVGRRPGRLVLGVLGLLLCVLLRARRRARSGGGVQPHTARSADRQAPPRR